MIEVLTNKIKDFVTCEELDILGIDRANNAKSRKRQLLNYPIDHFTFVNMRDRLKDFEREKSRLKVSMNKSLKRAKKRKK
jgi:hypothetical protein